MYIQRLKNKYKEILQSSRVEDDHEKELEKERKKYHLKHSHPMRVMTEYNENVCKSQTIDTSSTYILALKERVAQVTHNLQKKDQQIESLKEDIYTRDERIKQFEEKVEEGIRVIQNSQKRMHQAKMISGNYEKQLDKLRQTIEALTMDRQLIMKQSEYYKAETTKITKEKASQQKTIDSFQKTTGEVQNLKSENHHLKLDIKRMQQIVNQMCQKKISTDFTGKHYLGKPLKQASMWFPQNLVGQLEHFLKKEQIGQGNKKFLNNLVKFITKYNESAATNRLKASSSTNSRVKSNKTSHCRSSSMCDPEYLATMYDTGGISQIKKTQGLGVSILKKSLMMNKYKKIDSRKHTSDSILIPNHQMSPEQQILRQYRRMLEEVLEEKGVKAKTILDLTDEMTMALIQLFESQANL